MYGEDGKVAGAAIDRHIGKKLARRRIQLGLTHAHLAQELGVSLAHVQAFEAGLARMGASVLTQCAHVLKIELAYFFEGPSETRSRARRTIASVATGPTSTTLNDNKAQRVPHAKDIQRLVAAFTALPSPHLRKRAIEFVEHLTGI